LVAGLDYAGLLRRSLGKGDLAIRLVRKLVQQTEQDLPAMAAAIQSNDSAALAALAHRLKGAAANVSAESLRRTAAEMETLGRSGTTTDLATLLEKTQQELARLKAWPELSTPRPDNGLVNPTSSL
jgi:HPt (histidine-containing phosphotransfer) domain-containing protein